MVLGEAKSRIYRREVGEFADTVKPIEVTLSAKVIKVMLGYLIHPSASRAAVENGILLVASYQR